MSELRVNYLLIVSATANFYSNKNNNKRCLPILQNIRLIADVFDLDRHTKTTEIATTSVALKDIKLLMISEDPVYVTQTMNEVKHVSITPNFIVIIIRRYLYDL